MREVLPGVFHWTAVHPRIHIEVSSYWMEDGGVLIDPLEPPGVGLDWFAERQTPPSAVLLSNRHHYRHAGHFVERFGCSVSCNRSGLHEFGDDQLVTGFDPGDQLPGGVVAYEVGGICPDDTALHLPAQRALLFADGVVRGDPHGQAAGLGFVPDGLMDDPPQTRRRLLDSLTRLLDEVDFVHVLLAHGAPVIDDGREQLRELLATGGRNAFEL